MTAHNSNRLQINYRLFWKLSWIRLSNLFYYQFCGFMKFTGGAGGCDWECSHKYCLLNLGGWWLSNRISSSLIHHIYFLCCKRSGYIQQFRGILYHSFRWWHIQYKQTIQYLDPFAQFGKYNLQPKVICHCLLASTPLRLQTSSPLWRSRQTKKQLARKISSRC